MKTTNLLFIKRFGNMDYNYFTQSYTYEIIDAYDEVFMDDLGSYAEYKEVVVDTMTFTQSEVDEVGGFMEVKKLLQDAYDFVW